MKGCIIAVERDARLLRAALLVDGQLAGLEIDRLDENLPQPDAIYRVKITDLIPALGAAFADLGNGNNGFFPDATGLVLGQTLLAQVRREPDGDKAARLSPDIQYRGEGVVFTPNRPGVNVSRKIADEGQRARLSATLMPLKGQGGFVLRTAATALSSDALLAEAEGLVARHVMLGAANGLPGLVQRGPNAVSRLLTLAAPDAEIVCNSDVDIINGARIEDAPFDRLDIDARITDVLAPRIALSQGWISVDQTPALIAVDVNTGCAKGGNALLRVNLEAAARLPLILALRRLGGIVIVDFAGAPKGDARKRIETACARACHEHLDSPRLHGWGPAGLFEMACARPGRSLADLMTENDG